jgi:hypothetical protein
LLNNIYNPSLSFSYSLTKSDFKQNVREFGASFVNELGEVIHEIKRTLKVGWQFFVAYLFPKEEVLIILPEKE